tara:strand:- start:5748 stop:7025 length:1278 start_codon:yes stop_codon:yes gene_type:complete
MTTGLAAGLVAVGACLTHAEPPDDGQVWIADPVVDAVVGRVGSGTFTEGIGVLEAIVAAEPDDDQARFALGLVRAIRGFEILGQAGYRYGMSKNLARLSGPFFPLAAAVPENPAPEPVRLEDLRTAVLAAMAEAKAADAALAGIDGDFALRADIFALRLDLNGDGAAGEYESLGAMLRRGRIMVRGEGRDVLTELPVDFDRGDAEWLRGYCHLTMAAGEVMLAHDPTELFHRAGHVLFPENVTPYGYLKTGRSPFQRESGFLGVDPIDLVSMIHLIDFPVSEPERMGRAREHLLEAIGHSRAMWAHYDAETDDSDEWVPNPKQTAAFPRAVMDDDMRSVWLRFLDDAEAVLEGRVLVPFWRGTGERGLNARRVFTEPKGFDMILWVQGTAAEPYLEHGDQLDTRIWRDLERVFDERTFRHMFWLN